MEVLVGIHFKCPNNRKTNYANLELDSPVKSSTFSFG